MNMATHIRRTIFLVISIAIVAMSGQLWQVFAQDDTPEPQLCVEDQNLTPLAQLKIEEITDENNPDLYTSQVTYENPNGQQFVLTISSTNKEDIQEYTNNVSVCFEAVEANNFSVNSDEADLNDLFLNNLIQGTGLSESDFMASLDSNLVAGQTAFGMLKDYGIDENSLQTIQNTTVDTINNAAGTTISGDLAADIITGISSTVNELINQEPEASEIGVNVQLEWLNREGFDGSAYMIFFVIDPSIAQGVSTCYYGITTTYISVQVNTEMKNTLKGSVEATLRYDPNYSCGYFISRGPATASTTTSINWPVSSSIRRTYRLKIRGVSASNYYILRGSWYAN